MDELCCGGGAGNNSSIIENLCNWELAPRMREKGGKGGPEASRKYYENGHSWCR